MTHMRQMAPLLYIINFSKLRFRVKDERSLISAKNRVDLSSIPKYSHGRNFEPISTKFGTDVRNLKRKKPFVGGVKIH